MLPLAYGIRKFPVYESNLCIKLGGEGARMKIEFEKYEHAGECFLFCMLINCFSFSQAEYDENAANHQIKASVCFIRIIYTSVIMRKQSNNNSTFSAVSTYTHHKLINFMYLFLRHSPLFLFMSVHCHLVIMCMFTSSVPSAVLVIFMPNK